MTEKKTDNNNKRKEVYALVLNKVTPENLSKLDTERSWQVIKKILADGSNNLNQQHITCRCSQCGEVITAKSPCFEQNPCICGGKYSLNNIGIEKADRIMHYLITFFGLQGDINNNNLQKWYNEIIDESIYENDNFNTLMSEWIEKIRESQSG